MLQVVAKRARKPSAFAPAVGVKQPSSPPNASSSARSQSTAASPSKNEPTNSQGRVNPFKSALIHFTSGGLAAGLVRATLQPLDTCKTRLQASRCDLSMKSSKSINSILIPPNSGGFTGLYRGVIPGILGIVPAAAVYMLTFQTLKSKLGKKYPKRKNDLVILISAGIGDVIASLVRVPCEVLKQRLQIGIYRNMSHAVKTLISKGQIPKLYTGLSAQLVRDVPYAATEFIVYENLKTNVFNTNSNTISKVDNLLIGALAGAFAAIISNPADVVKTRLMTQIKSQATANATGVNISNYPYKGVRDCFVRITREEGVKTFAKGIAPRIAAKALQSALFFAAYEALRRAVSNALQVDPNATARPAH